MLNLIAKPQPVPVKATIDRIFAFFGSFLIAVAAPIGPMMNAAYESFNPVRLGATLIGVILLHLALRPRLWLCREAVLYAAFTAYMFLTLAWAPDANIGMNTLIPALNCVLIVILFGSLVAFHDLRAVVRGALCGFLSGAAFYTITVGFPFTYPPQFSYNAMAGMYLIGLFIALVYGACMRSRVLGPVIAVVLLLHIAATTSIKTNLGIALGTGAAGIVYFKSFFKLLGRHLFALTVVTALVTYAVFSNSALLERVQAGFDRVSQGVETLQSREDLSSGTSFAQREGWMNQGIKGWLRSPLLGSGVEAFRVQHGITSHSTPIDLLYNFGIVGFTLFYSIFASIAWRLYRIRNFGLVSLPTLVFAALVCYVFMSLSGTMYYNSFLAIYFGISTALIGRRVGQIPRSGGAALKANS